MGKRMCSRSANYSVLGYEKCVLYGKRLISSLNSLRESGLLCDGSLCTEDGFEMKIHSFLLCARSSVFRAVFAYEKIWKVTLPDIGREALEVLVQYIYTGTAKLNEHVAYEVLKVSKRYMLDGLAHLCEDYLESHLNVDNCLRSMILGIHYHMRDLEQESRRFALLNWAKVWQNNNDFKNVLSAEQLASILGDDMLNVKSEWEVQASVVKWVGQDIQTRYQHLNMLMSKARYDRGCHGEQDATEHPAIIHHLIYDLKIDRHFFNSRVPRTLVFCIGGWCNGQATANIEVFDCRAGSWVLCPLEDKVKRAYHGMAYVREQIYVVGGYNGYCCYRSVRSFNLASGIWMERNSMHEARCYVSVVALNHQIYAIGGFDGDNRKSSCERFDFTTNQWSYIAPMNHVRSDASATDHDGKIFVCGGFDGEKVLSSMETYDPQVDQWTLITRMPDVRSGHRLISYHDSLYVMGGFNGTFRLDSVYRYSLVQDKWVEETSMKNTKSNFAAVVLEDRLYVIGGFNGCCIIPDVESFSSEDNSWQPEESLNIRRSASGVCVVEDLRNAHEYSANGPYGKITLQQYDSRLCFVK